LDAQPEQHQQRARPANNQRAARNKLRNQWRRGQPYERHKKVKYNAAERFEGHTFSGSDHIKLATISHGSSASSAGARPKISAGGRGERISRDAIIHARPECVQIHCQPCERKRERECSGRSGLDIE